MGNVRREDLYEEVWGLAAMRDNATAAVRINRLRERLEQDTDSERNRMEKGWTWRCGSFSL